MINKYDNFLNESQIKELLNTIPNSKPLKGNTTAGRYLKNSKKSSLYMNKKLVDKILFNEKSKKIIESFVTAGGFSSVNNHISVYNKGDFYDWHIDKSILNKRSVNISYTLWLNNPEDYKGGELVVRSEYGTNILKEKAGTIFFYPAGLLHRVLPITSGQRKVIVGWLDCDYKNASERYLLIQYRIAVHSIIEHFARQNDVTKNIDEALNNLNSIESRLSQMFLNN